MRPHEIYKDVLVVEEDHDLNRQMCAQFEAIGFSCVGVVSISEAYVVLGKPLAPDLVILDLELSDGKGSEILSILQQPRFAHTKTVVLTGTARSSQDRLDPYKVDQLLLKPVIPRRLALLACHLLDEHQRLLDTQPAYTIAVRPSDPTASTKSNRKHL